MQANISGIPYDVVMVAAPDGTLVNPSGGGGGGAGTDREVVTVTYSTTSAGTGYSSGDIIQSITTLDLSSTTPVVNSVIWRNQTAGTTISAPSAAHLSIVGQTGLTDAQLRASAVPVSAASLPLPSGASTSANQATANTSLASIDTKVTGLATAANQATSNTALASIDTKVTGIATAANQTSQLTAIGATNDAAATSDTGTFSIIALIKRGLQNWTTLLSRTPALGQATMANSRPVVLASDQSVVSVKGARSPGDAVTGSTFVSVGGSDGTALRNLLLDSSGRIVIMPSNNINTAAETKLTLVGGTQQSIAANANRLFVTIDNPNAATIYERADGTNATTTIGDSFPIPGNTTRVFSVQEIGTGAISIICASNATVRVREISKA